MRKEVSIIIFGSLHLYLKEKKNDTAHHFLRHIRNTYAHCNINIVYEGRKHNKFYILKDYEMNEKLSMSGKIRSDLLWKMIHLLYS